MALILNARSSLARVIFISAMANLEKNKERKQFMCSVFVLYWVFLARKYDYFLSFGLVWTVPHSDADPGASSERHKSVFDKKYLLG